MEFIKGQEVMFNAIDIKSDDTVVLKVNNVGLMASFYLFD